MNPVALHLWFWAWLPDSPHESKVVVQDYFWWTCSVIIAMQYIPKLAHHLFRNHFRHPSLDGGSNAFLESSTLRVDLVSISWNVHTKFGWCSI